MTDTSRMAIHLYALAPRWSMASTRRAMEIASSLGYDGIVLPLRDHSDIDVEVLMNQLSEFGLTPLTTSNQGHRSDPSSLDDEVRASGVAHHLRSLDIAHEIGARHVGGILYSAFGPYDKGPVSASLRAAAASLATVAERAAELDMTMAIEIVNRYESNLVNTVEQALELLDMVGAPHLFLHLDTFHMNIEERNPLDALDAALPRLMYFEVDQNDRGEIEGGAIDFAPMLQKLKDASYRGWIGVEAFSSSISHPSVAEGVKAWRNTYSDPHTVARQGAHLIRRFL